MNRGNLHQFPHAAKSLVRVVALALLAGGGAAEAARADCTLAFTSVNVVPMTRETIVPDQTVIVEEGRIARLAPAATVNVAGCARVVDGRGAYLLPGLIDAHVHVESEAFVRAFGAKTAPVRFEDVLALYPAFGVTSVRVMSGAPDILAFRDAPVSSRPVPRLVVASPMISGTPPILPEPVTRVAETPEQVRRVVREFAQAGYDLIKIRENLRDDVFDALTDEARRLSLDVDGHVTRSSKLKAADLINSGQRGFAHLDEIARAMDDDGGGLGEAIVQRLKARDGYVTSTMVVLKSAAEQIADYDRLVARPEARFLHPLLTSTFWTRAQNPYLKPGVDRVFFLDLLAETKRALKLLNDRGVRILAGTDALNPMIIPGLSLIEELQIMADAGLTPYRALETATVNPTQVLRRLANAGMLQEGKDADLVLVAENPLVDLATLKRPLGVVLGGQWFDRAALDRRLEEVAASYGAP